MNYHGPFDRRHDSQWQSMIVETVIDYHQLSWPFEQALTRIVSTTVRLKLCHGYYKTNTYLEAEPCNRLSEKSSLFCKTVKENESQKHLYEFQTILQNTFYATPDTESKHQNGLKTNPIKTEHWTENQWRLHLFLVKKEEITAGKKAAGTTETSHPPLHPIRSGSRSVTENIECHLTILRPK